MAETESAPMKALREFATSLPETVEGTSCVNRAFRAGKRTFAYLGIKKADYYLMVKLDASLPAAEARQAKQPDNYQVGKHGWTSVRLPFDDFAPKGLLEGWIEESYRLLVPPALVARLPAKRATKRKAAQKATGKTPARKKTVKRSR